jgi:large subunit ribosomal protein L35
VSPSFYRECPLKFTFYNREKEAIVMPKLKTNRGAAKRLKVTKNGKVKYKKSFKNHILEKKSSKRKRQATNTQYASETMKKAIKQLLPYAF